AGRDAAHRARGLLAEARGRARREPASDDVLRARVRSKIGRVVSHPDAITTEILDGVVVLSGPVLADEARRLAATAPRVRGVRALDDRLERYDSPGRIPGLQPRGRQRVTPPSAMGRAFRSPGGRLVLGLSAAALAACGIARRDALGVGLGAGAVGLALGPWAGRPMRPPGRGAQGSPEHEKPSGEPGDYPAGGGGQAWVHE